MKDKYSSIDMVTAYGLLKPTDKDGDIGQAFPRSDAEDKSRGLRFIPDKVTVARRRGEQVAFLQPCRNPCCWYWQFQDDSKVYYRERSAYEQIAAANGKVKDAEGKYPDGVGPCPDCGNHNTRGGQVKE